MIEKIIDLFKKKAIIVGVSGIQVPDMNNEIPWKSVKKIVFVDFFYEYSGYYLTDEYQNKELYNSIQIHNKNNEVKIRTSGKKQVRLNIEEPFSLKYGTTCLYDTVFVEYESNGQVLLVGGFVNAKNKTKYISKVNDLKPHHVAIFNIVKVEGFNAIKQLS